ncbi:MAG: class I SAM-dependent methyltransferase [Acidimicrobiia bacterium]
MNAVDWDERYRATDSLWSATPNLFVEDRLRHAPPDRGLDLAAGEGRNASWLASIGWQMTAVDFSEVAVKRGVERAPEVEFIVADVLEWEPDSGFDLIVISYLQLLPSELEKTVRRAREWLEPGGEMFMIGHDVSNIADGWGGPQDPEILWDVPVMLDWLEGMRIVEAEVVRRPVETEDGRYARDALVRARSLSRQSA